MFAGFGLWASPFISMTLEFILIAAGGVLYFSSVWSRTGSQSSKQQGRRTWAIIAGTVMCLLLVLSLVTDILGIG